MARKNDIRRHQNLNSEFKRAWRNNRYAIVLTPEEKSRLRVVAADIGNWWIVRDTDGTLFVSRTKPVYKKKAEGFVFPYDLPEILPSKMIPLLHSGLGPLKVGFLMMDMDYEKELIS